MLACRLPLRAACACRGVRVGGTGEKKARASATPHSCGLPSLCRLREDALALRSGWDAQITELSKEMISKDLQIQSLQAEAVELKAHLARCQQDIGR